MVTKEQHPLHVPISTVVHCREAVAAFRKGIADFIGLKVPNIPLLLHYFTIKHPLTFYVDHSHSQKVDRET
jgi:hypothetical protein